MRKLKLLAGFAATLAIAALFVMAPPADVYGQGGSGCEGDDKNDFGGGGSFTAPAGMAIEYICIKAGRDVFTFYCGEDDKTGCYEIEWQYDKDGCCVGVVYGGGGTGRDCKAISHAAASYAAGDCEKK